MNQPSLSQARSRFTSSSIRWGFMWAMWAAVLWGAWYVPGSAVWFEAPYINLSFDTNAQFLLAAAVLTTFNAIAVLFFLLSGTGYWANWGNTFAPSNRCVIYPSGSSSAPYLAARWPSLARIWRSATSAGPSRPFQR